MPRILPALPCTPEQHEMLTSLARGKKIQARLKERARIVLQTHPTDPFAERPEIGRDLKAALRAG